jgi:hypothetical protein
MRIFLIGTAVSFFDYQTIGGKVWNLKESKVFIMQKIGGSARFVIPAKAGIQQAEGLHIYKCALRAGFPLSRE